MSRSVHTRPLRVRAERRARSPFVGRDHRDERRARAARRALKVQGLRPHDAPAAPERGPRLPRVVVRPPRPGHVHAATRAEVLDLLARLGPSFHHGVRVIELRRGADAACGRFVAPGRIELFDVPAPPWRVALARGDRARLARAGARLVPLDAAGEDGAVLVEWPGTALRDHALLDVLLHELGHHVVQHHAGKRGVVTRRTRDHEAAAELVAARARRALERPT